MITPNAKSSGHWDFKRYNKVLYVLMGCILLLIALLLLEKKHDGHFLINNSTIWYSWLVFISIILAFSIFLISYYTYYQMLNNRLAIVGFTFLIAGVFDTFHLLSYPDMPELSGMGASSGESIVYWLLAKIVNAAGLFVLVSTPEQRKDRIGRVWKLVLSMLFILTSVIFISIYPGMADLIYGSGGIKPVGNIIIVAIGIIYAYNTVRAVINLGKNGDPLYRTLACAFIIMFFCQVITIGLFNLHDIRSLLGCILKFVAFLLFFNIFYIQGIRKPYVLLSKAKEELNEYAYELDRLVDKRTHELRQVNKRLMADLEVARGIQQAMLPAALPQNEFVSFVSGYLPAENLSGDFYNVIKIDESHYGVYIGDVSGHGVSAAMLTVFTFQKIMSLMDEIGKEGMTIPAMVLKHLYDSFNAANFSEELYIVLIYGVYNTDTGIFSYASGGLNTSPLRLRPDGSIQELETEGFAICKLGDLISPKFSNRQVMLFPGDKLIIYTDGLVEAVNSEKQPYSKERLKDLISKHRKWNANRMTEKILEDLKQYTEHINDDVTILTVEVLRPF
jgi:sigma-B regulation protein RsbU (phosphoserine phosphatase)